jgi:hypothetical protein
MGDKHIKDNEIIEDKWYEFEVKVKGNRNLKNHKLGYSFRLGTKVHKNKDIKDIYYIGLRRGRTDFRDKNSFIKNFGFDLRTDFSQKTYTPIRYLLLFDKSFHLKNNNMAYKLKIGILWEKNEKYSGVLKREDKDNEYQLVIQPNIVF